MLPARSAPSCPQGSLTLTELSWLEVARMCSMSGCQSRPWILERCAARYSTAVLGFYDRIGTECCQFIKSSLSVYHRMVCWALGGDTETLPDTVSILKKLHSILFKTNKTDKDFSNPPSYMLCIQACEPHFFPLQPQARLSWRIPGSGSSVADQWSLQSPLPSSRSPKERGCDVQTDPTLRPEGKPPILKKSRTKTPQREWTHITEDNSSWLISLYKISKLRRKPQKYTLKSDFIKLSN